MYVCVCVLSIGVHAREDLALLTDDEVVGGVYQGFVEVRV